jgi:hypothetical protein
VAAPSSSTWVVHPDLCALAGRLEGRDMVAYEMSNDHVPALPTEAARILAAGVGGAGEGQVLATRTASTAHC